jgi:hypothetical protein
VCVSVSIPFAVPSNDDVSHGDIYHKLGSLEGKLETVLIQLSEKRTDMSGLFTRLSEIENRVSIGVGLAIGLSILIPIIVNASAPKIHFGHSEPPVEVK